MSTIDIIHIEELEIFRDRKELDAIGGKINRDIIRYRYKNGNYIYLDWSSEYIDDEEVFVVAARDITKTL